MALISVIIPVYNGEKTIRETIESVLAQTFSDWELIIINDGSTDSTLEVIANIKDNRLKVFSYPNAKQAASRNRGLSIAHGEFIAFLDADDVWMPDKLELQLKALQTNTQAAIAYSWTDCIDESGQFLRRGNHINLTGNVYAQMLLTDFLEHGSNPLIRRDALNQVGSFDESLPPAEDWDMWLRLAARYQFVAVPSVQVLYRISANSASSNLGKMEVACLQVIERAFSQAPESLQHLKKHSIANTYKYLTFKALEGFVERRRVLEAGRFLWYTVKNDRAILFSRIILKVLLKIAVILLLPTAQAQALVSRFKGLFNTSTILGYLRQTV
ncbi:glycosyltransferase [Planktothrix sp. FACHB-1355]|uniref:Glycosyltransferase n=1 Tax=Aerosakkonema funiforme FACHB-1375 TaxID=2949571 RepID=A0A926VIR7_9CYAN|nr:MULTISPECIES: glycosyltransferase [Oscillatoriales]MBD2184528.1 glycosyltransferase [Aerosakkonema funiforme FACHB-1375]MBD3561174.1 glycosyltransferase [Planktothrix sp. FACHB-1355]